MVLVLLYQDLLKNTRQHWTMMLLIPALTFCVFCTCGLVGVTMGANEIEKDLRTVARVAGAEWVSGWWCVLQGVLTAAGQRPPAHLTDN